MSNCNLFEVNIFINVIKRRCDNKKKGTKRKKKIKKKEGDKAEETRKPTLWKTDGTGSLGDNVEMNILKGLKKKEEDF